MGEVRLGRRIDGLERKHGSKKEQAKGSHYHFSGSVLQFGSMLRTSPELVAGSICLLDSADTLSKVLKRL